MMKNAGQDISYIIADHSGVDLACIRKDWGEQNISQGKDNTKTYEVLPSPCGGPRGPEGEGRCIPYAFHNPCRLQ